MPRKKYILLACVLIASLIIAGTAYYLRQKAISPQEPASVKTGGAIKDSLMPQRKPAQDILTCGEVVSFVARWQHPRTGLIPTEIAINNILNPKRDFASTYTLATCQQILWQAGLKEEAAHLSETVRALSEESVLSNTLDVQTGLNKDFHISAGPNAYWGLSFLREYQSSGQDKWLKAARKIGTLILSLQSENGGIVKDPNPHSGEHRVKSTEENMAAYAFLNFLYEVTKEPKYLEARDGILNWLANSGIYNRQKGYFLVGSFEDTLDPTYAIDANALAIIVLGPELLNNEEPPYVFGGKHTAESIADSFEKARVAVEYKHPLTGKKVTVRGFDFTDDAGRPGRKPTVSCEFSSQAVLAYLVMAQYEIKNNNEEAGLKYIALAEELLKELSKTAQQKDQAAALPYATSSAIRRFGFDNWYIPRAEANTSSSQIAFSLNGFNPYAVEPFKLKETLLPYADWMKNFGQIKDSPKQIMVAEEDIAGGVDLNIREQAVRDSDFQRPAVYYEFIYNKTEESLELAKRVLEVNLMTSFSCWIGSLADQSERDYDALGITQEGTLIKKTFAQLPEELARKISEQYLYYDSRTKTQWRKALPYNLDIDFSKGTYYAFEIDDNFSIVRQFKTEADVPAVNREDLKSIEAQYKSTAGLPPGHKIIRYFYALEVDREYNIVRSYNSIDELPGLASKVPIDRETYEALTQADEAQRQIYARAGYLPDAEGNLAAVEYGKYYYAYILALDTSRHLTIKTFSRISQNEIVGGTRSILADWEVDEKAKLNAIKYEAGLLEGMVMRTPLAGPDQEVSRKEPVWIYVGQPAVKEEHEKLRFRMRKLLAQINREDDALRRQELIVEFDRLRWEASWRDNEDVLHVIVYGLEAVKDNFGELEKARQRAELSYRKYVSILGYNEEGNDLRDTFGRVWLKVINKKTEKILHVEVYDIAGNLEFLLGGHIEIDPLFKTVTAETRTDVLYDENTGQMLGSHSYYIDEAGQWVADISEGIFRGYTPDKKHFLIERRIFKKDNNGNIIYQDNEPLYSEKIEYYAPEGDLLAQISANTLTVISYERGSEVVRRVYVLEDVGAIKEKNINLDELTAEKVWVRAIEPTGEIYQFKEIITSSLSSLEPSKREQAANRILNMLGAEEIGRISDSLLLEKSIVSNNLSGEAAATELSHYHMYFEPGDYLGRERIKIQSKTIRIPVQWIPRTQIAARTLNFNFSGELVSVSETLPYQRADSFIPKQDLEKFKVLGIKPDTLLPITREKIYRLITEDGITHLSSTIHTIKLSCLLPDDMLGRELVSTEFSMTWKETRLHQGSTIEVRKNIFGRRNLLETWQEANAVKRSRVIGEEKETLVNEWYKQGLSLEKLRLGLIKDSIISAEPERILPENYKELNSSLVLDNIKQRHLLIKKDKLQQALKTMSKPPYGVLPAHHIIKASGEPGEIKYFAGLVKYPRSDFEHEGIDITYEEQIKPFKLPEGPPVIGFKYGVLNNPSIVNDVHTLNGQLIIRERPYVQVRLINMYPIRSSYNQTEYYNPMVPYSYQSPIMIKRYFPPGRQPAGQEPGILIIGYFKDQATTYLPNGWQIQDLIERRPLDIDHWVRSELYYDTDGQLKYKKQHIESKPLYYVEKIGLKRPLVLILLIFGSYISLCKLYEKKRRKRSSVIKPLPAPEVNKGLIQEETILLKQLLPNTQHEQLTPLESAYRETLFGAQLPVKAHRACKTIYRPLITAAFEALGARADDYSAAQEVLLSKIANLFGRTPITFQDICPEEAKEFQTWSASYGSQIAFKEDNICIKDKPFNLSLYDKKITALVLFRLIFDASGDFKATVPELRYFIFDKCLKMLADGNHKDICREIESDISCFAQALKTGYGHGAELTKKDILTYEDIAGLFCNRRAGFLDKFLALRGKPAGEKLSYLASINGRILKPKVDDYRSYLWLKTYDDRQGLRRFISNLKPLWLPLTPLFMAVIAAGMLMGLKINLIPFNLVILQKVLGFLLPPLRQANPTHINILVQNISLMVAGIAASAGLIKRYLGSGTMKVHDKTSLRSFWVLFTAAVFLWGIFSIFIISWTTTVTYKASYARLGWMIFINSSAALLSLVFVVASFYSLFYAVISGLGFLEGKIEGVGQIKSWSRLLSYTQAARVRFGKLIPFKNKPGSSDMDKTWSLFYNSMINDLYNDYKLTQKERDRLYWQEGKIKPITETPPAGTEARARVEKYINSWLMDIPPAISWENMPSLSVMVTAFNEPVAYSFEEINSSERGARETRLNHLINRYNDEWLEFTSRLSDEEFERWIKREELINLSGLQRLPDGLAGKVKEKIRLWANMRTQPIERTIREVSKIKDAFAVYARLFYPQASEADLSALAAEKLQIMLNYEGFHQQKTRDYDRTSLMRLLKQYPFLEAYWNAVGEDYSMELDDKRLDYKKDTDGGLHKYNPEKDTIELVQRAPLIRPVKKGKPSGFNQALSYVRGDIILFFDANASVRAEDALKLPLAMGEFYRDKDLAEVLFSEYIYTSRYSWIAEAIRFNEETFTSVTQRTLNLFDACGFYGHSALIRTNVVTASGGIPQDYVSEDIIMSIKFWLKGYKSTHKEYLMLGKGRETSFYSALVPFTKWSVGSSNLALGRIQPKILGSDTLHYAQKIMLMFSFSFFYHILLVLFINFLYLWLVICWGVNAFMTVPFPFIFAVIGLLFNQSITTMGVVYLIENNSPLKTVIEYFKLVGKNYLLYTAAIPSYVLGFVKGLQGKVKIAISSKGWNLQHVSLKDIWGDYRFILSSIIIASFIGIPLLFILIELKMMPFAISPFIAFIPLTLSFILFLAGSAGCRNKLSFLCPLQDELIPQGDLNKASAVKLQIIYSIGLLAFLGVGFIMWGVIFSSFASKLLFILSILYISPPISYMLVPVLANSQPFALFKEWISSRLWNYVFIPVIAAFTLGGSLIVLTHLSDIKAEYFVYLGLAALFLVQWVLLKWKLSGYVQLKRWSMGNLRRLKNCAVAFHSRIEDNIYFAHQQLLELETNRNYINLIHRLLITAFTAGAAIFILYALHEFDVGFYNPWLWSLPAAGILVAEIMSILATAGERILLKGFLDSINLSDLQELSGNEEYMDTIWQKLPLFYRNALVRVYDEDERAKKYLQEFIAEHLQRHAS